MTREDFVSYSKVKFNIGLANLTEAFFNNISVADFNKSVKSLKTEFDSFAKIDEFTDFGIIDCYNRIKISLMKWEQYADKDSIVSVEFKKYLDYFYEVMKDLYFYEIFGFFSTTVHPEDIPELNLPCKVFCGCADGWQKEPYLDEVGRGRYTDVIRFQDPRNTEVPLCITIDNPQLFENREKCSLTDEQLESLYYFVDHYRENILLHNAEVIDSIQFLSSIKLRVNNSKSKYCISFEYSKYTAKEAFSSGVSYVDMDDMSFTNARRFYKEIFKEIELESSSGHYNLDSFKVIKCRPPVYKCCFCGSIMNDIGNSTWPVYYNSDAEKYRCCNECNSIFIIPSREDPSLIMEFRERFGIDYTEYKGESND